MITIVWFVGDPEDSLLTEQAQLESETKRTTEGSRHLLSGQDGKTKPYSSNCIPLLHLVKQLLRNECQQTLYSLANLGIQGGGDR